MQYTKLVALHFLNHAFKPSSILVGACVCIWLGCTFLIAMSLLQTNLLTAYISSHHCIFLWTFAGLWMLCWTPRLVEPHILVSVTMQ